MPELAVITEVHRYINGRLVGKGTTTNLPNQRKLLEADGYTFAGEEEKEKSMGKKKTSAKSPADDSPTEVIKDRDGHPLGSGTTTKPEKKMKELINQGYKLITKVTTKGKVTRIKGTVKESTDEK